MIKAIIFDFDGVLADSEHVNIESGIRTFRELGYELNDEDKGFIVGKHSKDTVPHFIKIKDINVQEEQAVERYRDIFEDLWSGGVQAMPAIEKTLHILKQKNIVLALATNNRQSRVDAFLKQFKLEDVFSVIVDNKRVTRRKPDPEVYLKALEELHLPPDVVLAVEDSNVGLEAAKAAGLRCAVIPNKYTKSHDFSSANFILKTPQDLLSLI